MQETIKKFNLEAEATGLIDFFGGYVPEDRDWRAECRPYFENRELDQIHWDSVYYKATELQTHP